MDLSSIEKKLFVIGDSHLKICLAKTNAALTSKNQNIDFGLKNYGIFVKEDQGKISDCIEAFEELQKINGDPNIVILMCGNYELMLQNSPNVIVKHMMALIKKIAATNVEKIVVCSIFNRKVKANDKNNKINKDVQTMNKMLKNTSKNVLKSVFIDVSPPGKFEEVINDDGFHLKYELYFQNVYQKLCSVLKEDILDDPLTNEVEPAGRVEVEVASHSPLSVQVKYLKNEASVDSRLSDFKEVLHQDYENYCTKEKTLAKQKLGIENEIEENAKNKIEAKNVYQKLFNEDLEKLLVPVSDDGSKSSQVKSETEQPSSETSSAKVKSILKKDSTKP